MRCEKYIKKFSNNIQKIDLKSDVEDYILTFSVLNFEYLGFVYYSQKEVLNDDPVHLKSGEYLNLVRTAIEWYSLTSIFGVAWSCPNFIFKIKYSDLVLLFNELDKLREKEMECGEFNF